MGFFRLRALIIIFDKLFYENLEIKIRVSKIALKIFNWGKIFVSNVNMNFKTQILQKIYLSLFTALHIPGL